MTHGEQKERYCVFDKFDETRDVASFIFTFPEIESSFALC